MTDAQKRDEAIEKAIEATTAIIGHSGGLDANAATFRRALAEQGYGVLPLEPTGAMVAAGAFEIHKRRLHPSASKAEGCYRAMTRAAEE